MKLLFFCATVMVAMPAYADSAKLPIKGTIINLATMPIEQALAFCDQRNLECPAIRFKANISRRQRTDDTDNS